VGAVVELMDHRPVQDRRKVWCLCWSCGHAHLFTSEEVLRDAGSYERFEELAVCLVCMEKCAVIVQPKPKITFIQTG
jgi:hypothetical protein